MALDFRASQFRGAKFISSGSTGTGAKLLFYDISADSTTTPNIGEINTAKFNTGSIGTDIFLYVSGNIGGNATEPNKTVLPNVVLSGTLWMKTSSLNTLPVIYNSGRTGGIVVDANIMSLAENKVVQTGNLSDAGSAFTDTFLFVSGGIGRKGVSNSRGIATFGGDVHISGNLSVAGTASNTYWESSASNYIYTTGSVLVSGSVYLRGASNVYTGLFIPDQTRPTYLGVDNIINDLFLKAASATAGGTLGGGAINLYAGTGGVASGTLNSTSPGGTISLIAGEGGTSTNLGTSAQSSGGGIAFTAGNGAINNVTSSRAGGTGGAFSFSAGTGGAQAGAAGISGSGGIGGSVSMVAGQGGTSDSSGGRTGAGGNFSISAGSGGDQDSTDGINTGNGGLIQFYAGNGGICSSGSSGNGGNAIFAAGAGGTIYNGGRSGIGGHITMSAGQAIGLGAAFPETTNQAGSVGFFGGSTVTNLLFLSGSDLIFGVDDNSGTTQTFRRVVFNKGTSNPPNDTFFYVSGVKDGKARGVSGSVAVFNGDVVISGNLYFSGSVRRYTNYVSIGYYVSTTATSSNPQVAGQTVLSQSEIPTSSVVLRGVLSSTTSSTTASIRLYNVTSGSFVHIGGAGVTTLNTVSTTPVQIQSVNLFTATNFGTGSNIYEVQVYTATGSQQAVFGGAQFVCT